jgi:endogenous inhibitor of DNA gyrase (YacG/DUF329 family)
MEPSMIPRACAHCGQLFQPRPQVPNQAYCPSPECQRVRKVRWQQEKLRTDPAYRDNQRDAQRAWLDRRPDYWKTYRATNPSAVVGGGESVVNEAHTYLAKMDVSNFPPGLYRLQRIDPVSPGEIDTWLVKITPVRPD